MRALLRKDVEFQWNHNVKQPLRKSKHYLLSRDIMMAYFDPHRKTRLKTDAGL